MSIPVPAEITLPVLTDSINEHTPLNLVRSYREVYIDARLQYMDQHVEDYLLVAPEVPEYNLDLLQTMTRLILPTVSLNERVSQWGVFSIENLFHLLSDLHA